MKKVPKGTTRGVVVINKQAKIEVVFAGVRKFFIWDILAIVADLRIQGPAATVDEVRNFISNSTEEANEDVGNVAEGERPGKEMEKTETRFQESEELNQSEPPRDANGDKSQVEVAAEIAAEVADSAEKLDQGA